MYINLSQNWWTLAIRGVAALIFGVLAFAWPGITLVAFVMVFAVYAIVDGVFAMAAAVNASRTGARWWALLLEGLLGVGAGLIAFSIPTMTAFFLLYLIAAWSVITGVFELITAVRIRKEVSNEWLMGLSGVASVFFGLLLFVFPQAGALALVWWIGAYAFIFGVLLLALAVRLRAGERTSLTSASL